MTTRRTTTSVIVTVFAVALLLGSAVAAIGRLDGPETRFAFVVRGDNPVDAVAAAPIAGRLDAPVLLTPPAELSRATHDGLVDQAPDVVVIAGGVMAITPDVADAIGEAVPDAQVRRVSGESRYDTAAALAALVREYQPAFAYIGDAQGDTNAFGISCPGGQVLTGITAEGEPTCVTDRDTDTDTNAYGIGCPAGQLLSGITADGQPTCTTDQVDGGDADTVDGQHADEFAPAWPDTADWRITGLTIPAGGSIKLDGAQLTLPAACSAGQDDVYLVLVTASGVVTTEDAPAAGHLDVRLRLTNDGTPDDTTEQVLQVDELGEDHSWSETTFMTRVGHGAPRFGGSIIVDAVAGADGSAAFPGLRFEAAVVGHQCQPG